MLTIKPIANADAAIRYFRDHLSRGDNYFAKDQDEVRAQWQGRGVELLGLPQDVTQEHFERLMHNQHPITGKRLSPRDKVEAIPAYEVTTDLPKWATLAYEIGGDKRVMEIDRAAWSVTLEAMQDQDMQTRVRIGGADHTRHTGNLLCAPYEHIDTRPLNDGTTDPHRHRHGILISQTFDPEEGRWKRGYFREMKRNAPYYQALYHMEQAKGLRDAGYAIERDGKGFDLVGMDQALRDKFSRRTGVIERVASERNITDPKMKAQLGKLTRNRKRDGVSKEGRRAEWMERCTPEELEFLKLASKRDVRGNETTAKEAMDYALWHSFDKKSAVPEKTILAEAMMQAVGSALTPDDIHKEFDARRDSLIMRHKQGVTYVSLPKIKAAEDRVVDFVSEGRGTCSMLGVDSPELYEGLGPDQAKAAKQLVNSRNRVDALEGPGGSGKTHMMKKAVIKAAEAAGRKVYSFAPSSEASRGNLRDEGLADADTVQMLLVNQKMHQKVKGQALWIDEAGLLGVDDMNRVFDLAQSLDCRVILSGDTAQHTPVARGDALKLIKDYSGLKFAQLTETRRQTNKDYLAAVKLVRDGKIEAGVEKLDKIGSILEIPVAEDRFTRVAVDYLDAVSEKRRNGDPKTALVVAPTHAEADKVTQYVRDGLKDIGKISREEREIERLKPMRWSDAERSQARQYKPGMVVEFSQRVKGFGPSERVTVVGRQGDRVKVKKADDQTAFLPLERAEDFEVYRAEKLEVSAGDKLRSTKGGYAMSGNTKVHIDNGRVLEVAEVRDDGSIKTDKGLILPPEYGHLAHGYTTTSYSSQSRTVDKVFISMGHDALVAADRKQFYVSITRGRDSVKIYTDNKQELKEAIARPGERMSASEMMDRKKVEAKDAVKAQKDESFRERARKVYQELWRKGREMVRQLTQRKERVYAR